MDAAAMDTARSVQVPRSQAVWRRGGKDLNDLLRISTDSYRSSAKVINNEMRF